MMNHEGGAGSVEVGNVHWHLDLRTEDILFFHIPPHRVHLWSTVEHWCFLW